MGCDIHMMVEQRNGDGTWSPVEAPRGLDEWADQHGYATDWYHGRRYDEFAILADVRNGFGFAGVDTGDGFVPISSPRGVPGNASVEYKALVERWGCDGHSHSWHTLADLQAYDFTRTTTKRGWVQADDFIKYRECGKPDAWCGGVGGREVKHLTNDEMAAKIGRGESTEHCYTQVAWQSTYAQVASYLVEKLIPALSEVGRPDGVRIVFFFDN